MTFDGMGTWKNGWRIVVAEDESIIAHDLKSRLTSMGFVVLAVVKTGEEAIQETLTLKPDVVLFDISLKGNVDGIQAAQQIRSRVDIPVVFATASSDPVTFERSQIAEPYGFVFKPFDDRELRATLELAITKNMSERLVRQSESRYRLLFENNLAGVFRLDGEWRILDCNKALLTMLGLPPGAALNRRSALTFLAGRAEGDRLVAELRSRGRIEGRELCLTRDDGSRLWVVMNIVATEGTIAVGTVIDVTERKQIEAQLSEQRQLMQLLIDNIPDQVYLKDLQHRFLFINPGCAKLLGKTADAILGKTDADFFPPDLAAQYAADERRILEGGDSLVNLEEPQIDAAGTERWSLTTKIPFRGQDGSIKGLMGINRDITAQKRYEEILQDDVRFQQMLLDAIPAPVFYRDKGGRFLGCNVAFEQFYGLSQVTIMGQTISTILPGEQDETHTQSDTLLFANPGSTVYEAVTRNAAGEQKTGLFHKATFADAGGVVEGTISVFVDLSDRQKLREELARSEHRYRSMFEENNAVMLLLDPDTGMIVDANPAAMRFYGYPREVLTAMNISEINPKPLETLKDGLSRARDGTQRVFTWKHRMANGEMRDVEVHSGPVTVDGRHNVLSIIHDVTAKKRAEEAQRQSDERFRIISENVPDLIAVLGPDSRVQYASPAYRTLGFDETQLEGSRFVDMVHAEDVRRVEDAFHETSRTLCHQSVEHQIRVSDGSWRIVDTSITLLVNDLETRFIMVSRDITERRRRDNLVRKLSSAVEHSPASIVITSANGTIEYVNPKFCEITGYSAAEALGNNPRLLKSGDKADEEYEHLWQTITSGHEWRGRFSNKRKDGSLFWEQASISPIADSNGVITHFVAVKEDISDQIRQEQERLALDKELRKRNDSLEHMVSELRQVQDGLVQSEKMASIGQLTAGIAHEINNPLAFVTSNLNRFSEYFEDVLGLLHGWKALSVKLPHTEPIQKDLDALHASEGQLDLAFMTEDFGRLMQHTREGTDRIKRIVEQLRGFTHVSGNGLMEANINEALEDTVMITWNELKYKATVIRNYGEIPLVACNIGEIKQVFVNLLVNAGQAIQEKGEIHLRTHASGHEVLIQIQDSGCGISPDNLKRIFDPFFTTKPVGKGTGLGLWITANLVQKHLGEITVRSDVGKGTTFTISLPIHQPESQKDKP